MSALLWFDTGGVHGLNHVVLNLSVDDALGRLQLIGVNDRLRHLVRVFLGGFVQRAVVNLKSLGHDMCADLHELDALFQRASERRHLVLERLNR